MNAPNLTTSKAPGEAGFALGSILRNKKIRWALYLLGFLLLIAVFAPLLANEKPLYIKLSGHHFFPAFTDINPFYTTNFYVEPSSDSPKFQKIQLDNTDWKHLTYEAVIWCPVPYSPTKSDYANADCISPFGKQSYDGTALMPLRFRHLLGTGMLGNDLLAGLIHGTRTSMSIGIITMLLASIIGLLLGCLSGYFGDTTFKIQKGTFFGLAIGIFLGFFYAFYFRSFALMDSFARSSAEAMLQILYSVVIFIGFVSLFSLCGKRIYSLGKGKDQITLPLDSIISRTIEIVISLPTFILILSIAAISQPSIFNLILLIAFTSWTNIARLTRAEILRIKKLDYIQAAKALGYSPSRIILKHALLNAIAPALVAISFGISSTILIESSLSFLGVGLPFDAVTWGSLLGEGRHQFHAWWMTVFPGIAIFTSVSIYNILGDGFREIR